tara:strand:- start:16467 stop:17102 length:636 start_codon:yes stop_codon:yes gene_type:complete
MKPVIIFDWDGVVVDSNAFKWKDAWEETFGEDQKKAARAVALLSTPEGRALNRYELIAKIAPESSDLYQREIAERFSKVLQDGVTKINLMPGIREVIDSLKKKGFVMHVISATKEEDLIFQAKYFGVDSYFTSLFGNPRTKLENFNRIEDRYDHRYVVIGDGGSDYALAQAIGAEFIGVANKWNAWGEDEVMKKYIISIEDVPKKILNLSK